MSVRFVKFALVGASGTLVNLCAFIAFVKLFGLRDWRISALASLVANLTNYVFNNAWTFVDRGHRGWSLLRGYFSYLAFSLVGLSASTLTFAGLSRAFDFYLHPAQSSKESYIFALGFQFAAILVGTGFNYELNKRFTFRDKDVSARERSDLNVSLRSIGANSAAAPVECGQVRGAFPLSYRSVVTSASRVDEIEETGKG